MGSMAFHLAKGVLGLRMDYLARTIAVRQHVVQRLQAGENPIAVFSSLDVGGVQINALADDRHTFKQKLALLLPMATDGDDHDNRSPVAYEGDHNQLHSRNSDHTGNRERFMQYWLDQVAAHPEIIEVLRQELIKALSTQGRRIDFWWDCSLADGEPATVFTSLEVPGVARVFFRTDHEPVESDDAEAQPPLDITSS